MESEELRKILSYNIKNERKKLGFTQEKLAEIADLSSQTVNDIEGCRMWVSDKTITKLAQVLNIEVYQLLIPVARFEALAKKDTGTNKLLTDLEENVVKNIRQQFRNTIEHIELNNDRK